MLDQNTIDEAKKVDIKSVLDYFQWKMDNNLKMTCPSITHNDSSPSCSYNSKNNTVRCFGCGKTFDSIGVYQALSVKTGMGSVAFPWATKAVLALEGNVAQTVIASPMQKGTTRQKRPHKSPYEMIVHNSNGITGYELNYLHKRGIFLYDSYVYKGEVYTIQNINKALQTETDPNKLKELNEIKSKGKFYKGIAPILKANRIQVKHNYWQGVNSIIFQVEYNYEEDEELQKYSLFLDDTERHMAIQKSLDDKHNKKALGALDFTWIAESMGSTRAGDIYICEGLEDSLSYTMHGEKSISLNSLGNLNSLMNYFEHDYRPGRTQRFIISFDHDKSGQEATEKLMLFFEDYISRHSNRKYNYATCEYPSEFHDINDYWVSKVFG